MSIPVRKISIIFLAVVVAFSIIYGFYFDKGTLGLSNSSNNQVSSEGTPTQTQNYDLVDADSSNLQFQNPFMYDLGELVSNFSQFSFNVTDIAPKSALSYNLNFNFQSFGYGPNYSLPPRETMVTEKGVLGGSRVSNSFVIYYDSNWSTSVVRISGNIESDNASEKSILSYLSPVFFFSNATVFQEMTRGLTAQGDTLSSFGPVAMNVSAYNTGYFRADNSIFSDMIISIGQKPGTYYDLVTDLTVGEAIVHGTDLGSISFQFLTFTPS